MTSQAMTARKATRKQTSEAASRGAKARAVRARRRGPSAITSVAEAVDGPQRQPGVGIPHALSVKQEEIGLGACRPAPGEPVVGPRSERAAPRGAAAAHDLGCAYARPCPRAAQQDLPKGAQPTASPCEPRPGEKRELAQIGAPEGAVVPAQVGCDPDGTPEEVAAEGDRSREVPPLEVGLTSVRVREAPEDVGALARRRLGRPALAWLRLARTLGRR